MICKFVVLAHYNFKNKQGRQINTTKIKINLGDFGVVDICSELANKLDIMSVHEGEVSFDDEKNKFVLSSIIK